ncbi:UDP-glucose 4-epimerase GalE [Halomonas elongata]|uniref:UDP-glucose 4-epimerase n=1 Tax=Halomonas elongata (strain ATCC 33173 / DSM 2581 / NBRC 15536 / NCIMB 2198 / 1H9) TaxID=768066 RepID=E1VC12_HALED|nr:UDP-glucose 4-epimerase GalE [Halomonas elongata]MDL4862175.1 UDP-glucose 4-epimerase GalE [Halomonas elongata]WBF19564.1 UDP-glucose 4-epimerase GalE [Halomonas elongata]WPU48428.1 UDP-glucose 4-epimerase GalE [Halomonas elongata DSM 2581]CBV42282.1 UDP-glucose 4-epimerase [Halomonas elongata DSM 2581]
MSNTILVVGGCGYIGSHMVKQLARAGNKVVVLDNLSTGFRELAKYGQLVVGDLGDVDLLERLFREHSFDGVMHFAANSLVGESVTEPSKYYRNNVGNTLGLLDVMVRHDVRHFIFSSTAATFGEPERSPIDERHPQAPINPYGASKLMVEQVLSDYAHAYGLNSVSLRYFNACGADPEGELGECHDPETHLIPLILQAASGRRESITVFGRDYATEDGTCVRDYIHIEDLCSAHALALSMILENRRSGALAYNLGNGQGFSVQQVIDVVKSVVARDGCSLKVEEGDRRPGDPAVLVADAARAKEELGWRPAFADLEKIVTHAWQWEKQLASM